MIYWLKEMKINNRPVAQLVERCSYEAEVAGSIPAGSIIFTYSYGLTIYLYLMRV